ncbi:MAG: hypothetical protein AAF548_19250 [Actinomycetota bacterium]
MSVVPRQWIVLAALAVLAVVGAVLIVTATEDEAPPELESVTTAEGIVTQVPVGWTASGDFPWEYFPPDGADGFDQWTVTTTGCSEDDCLARTADQWLELAPSFPTFVDVRANEGTEIFNLSEEVLVDAYVMRATTQAAGDLVFVAAFAEGVDEEFVACSARLGFGSDRRLGDEIVDVCRETARDR